MSLETYQGSCHCGRVHYEVKLDLEKPVTVCNCSICGRTGTMLSFVPADQFTLKGGEDILTDYQFNKRTIDHLFCSHCGVRSFARGQKPDGSPIVAVNVRCLEKIDLEPLQVRKFDGKSL